MAKYCTYCGNRLSEDDIFCGECGRRTGHTSMRQPSYYEEQPLQENYYSSEYYDSPKATHSNRASHSGKHTKSNSKRSRKRKLKKRILSGVFVFAAIVIVAVVWSSMKSRGEGKTTSEINMGETTASTASSGIITSEGFASQNSTQPALNTQAAENNAKSEPLTGLANDQAMVDAGYNLLVHGGQFGDIYFARYYIYDMDNDGREEIIIVAGTCEADGAILVYTYRNGTFENIGSAGGSHCSICADTQNGGLIVHHGIQGYENVEALTIKDGALNVETIIAERFVDGNYTEFDYCSPLSYYAINDTTPFNTANITENAVITAEYDQISVGETFSEDDENNEESIVGAYVDLTTGLYTNALPDLLDHYKYSGYTVFQTYAAHMHAEHPYYHIAADSEYGFWAEGNPMGSRYIYGDKENIKMMHQQVSLSFPVTNVYQLILLLNEDIPDFDKLLDVEPEFAGNFETFLVWRLNDVIFIVQYVGEANWQATRVLSYSFVKT